MLPAVPLTRVDRVANTLAAEADWESIGAAGAAPGEGEAAGGMSTDSPMSTPVVVVGGLEPSPCRLRRLCRGVTESIISITVNPLSRRRREEGDPARASHALTSAVRVFSREEEG